jgi:hypothetical protein
LRRDTNPVVIFHCLKQAQLPCHKNMQKFPFCRTKKGRISANIELFGTRIYSLKKGVNSQPESVDKVWKVRYNNKLRLLAKKNE